MIPPFLDRKNLNSRPERRPSVRHEGSTSPHVLDLRQRSVPIQTPKPVDDEVRQTPSRDRLVENSSFIQTSRVFNRIGFQGSVRRAASGASNLFIQCCRVCGQILVTPFSTIRRGMRFARGAYQQREQTAPWSPPTEFRPTIRREVSFFILSSLVMMLIIGVIQSIPGVEAQKQDLLKQGSIAVSQVMASTDALKRGQWQKSMESIESARKTFEEIESKLQSPDSWTLKVAAALPFTTQYQQAKNLARIGTDLSTSAEYILEAATGLQNHLLPMGDKLRLLDRTTKNVSQQFMDAQQALEHVSTLRSDPRIQPLLGQLQMSLGASQKTFTQFSELFGALNQAVGTQHLKRYLVIFENSDELRPSGGFMGSFVLVDVVDGVITHQEYPKGGSYDLQGSLSVAVRPPTPLGVFRSVWQFHDTNWFVDWPTSARTIQWFYEHSGGPSVDGVVAITSPLLERVLDITGPIDVKGETITSKNVIDRVQRKVEFEYDKTKNNPKEYIGDLAVALQNKLTSLNQEQMIELFRLVDSAIRERLVMVSTTDAQLNDRLSQIGALGEIKKTDDDYASVVWSNIGGEKTDRVIQNSINITTRVQGDGALENTLTIHREHHGIPGQTFYGVTNVEYMRAYVPRGATIVSADGFIKPPRVVKKAALSVEDFPGVQEYAQYSSVIPHTSLVQTQEYDKTVFGGWVSLPAGADETLTIVYRLPMKMQTNKAHTLLYQKQPGALHTTVSYSVILPPKTNVIAAVPEEDGTTVRDNTISFQARPLISDRMYGTLAQF